MRQRLGLDWRVSLAQEEWFYFCTCRNWRAMIQARRRNTPLNEFVLRSGERIHFSTPPWQIFLEIWRDKQYTPPFFSKAAPRTVVDIGANIGIFALYARRLWRHARILAFEPGPENFQLLEQNIRASQAADVELHRVAVASAKGTMSFYLKQESGWHSIFGERGSTMISVETIGLQDIFQDYSVSTIDFLKLDCEGAEFSILNGKEDLVRERIHRVAMEYHEVGGHRVQEIESMLKRLGYVVSVHPQPLWQTGLLYAVNSNCPEV